MILYSTQPKTSTTGSHLGLFQKKGLVESVRYSLRNYGNRGTTEHDATTLLTDASLVGGMIAASEYENILVIPSFQNLDYPKLRDRQYRPIRSAGDHLLPVVHKMNESAGNIYVAQPKEGNAFDTVYDNFGVQKIPVNGWFKIDSSFEIDTDIKFDAVVLLGNEGYKKGKFNAQAVKKKFAKYCTDNFHLIDVYRGNLRQLTGGSKDKSELIKTLVKAVNTPTPIYRPNENRYLSGDFVGTLKRGKSRHQYFRLVDTLHTINDWYKIYE